MNVYNVIVDDILDIIIIPWVGVYSSLSSYLISFLLSDMSKFEVH